MGFTRFIKTHLKGALQALIGPNWPHQYPLKPTSSLYGASDGANLISTLC